MRASKHVLQDICGGANLELHDPAEQCRGFRGQDAEALHSYTNEIIVHFFVKQGTAKNRIESYLQIDKKDPTGHGL